MLNWLRGRWQNETPEKTNTEVFVVTALWFDAQGALAFIGSDIMDTDASCFIMVRVSVKTLSEITLGETRDMVTNTVISGGGAILQVTAYPFGENTERAGDSLDDLDLSSDEMAALTWLPHDLDEESVIDAVEEINQSFIKHLNETALRLYARRMEYALRRIDAKATKMWERCGGLGYEGADADFIKDEVGAALYFGEVGENPDTWVPCS